MFKNREATEVRVDDRTETVVDQPPHYAGLSFSTDHIRKPIADEFNLISLSQQGDAEAFGLLYDRYVGLINHYVLVRVSDNELANDITSRVFIKVWEKLPSYQIRHTPIGDRLYRIAHNAVIDHYRTRRMSISLEEINSAEISCNDGIEEKLDLQIKLDQLRKALQKLTDGQRKVLIMKFIEGLSVEEIARQLGKQQGAVRALQMRGLRELAKSPSLQAENQSYDQ